MKLNVFYNEYNRPLIQNKNRFNNYLTCTITYIVYSFKGIDKWFYHWGTPYDPITTFFFLQQKVQIGENTQKMRLNLFLDFNIGSKFSLTISKLHIDHLSPLV